MKEYIQPEVELVKFTSETVTGTVGGGQGSIGGGQGGTDINEFGPSDIVIP